MGDLIISDAATVLLLSSSGSVADPRALDAKVFGESVLNDAVAIVLFNTFLKFYESQSEFTTGAIASLMVEFVFISLGSSVACGVVTSNLFGKLKKFTPSYSKWRRHPANGTALRKTQDTLMHRHSNA
ncbi:hypothetical protein ATCC90586_003754 [Pythium insidiosum]|nr:hypothetical protein ATCC90586_003754 [Pythium insidiosum]